MTTELVVAKFVTYFLKSFLEQRESQVNAWNQQRETALTHQFGTEVYNQSDSTKNNNTTTTAVAGD